MKRSILPLTVITILCSFIYASSPLKGVWEYRGELLNGKMDTSALTYKLQRTYDDKHYQARVIEKGQKTFIYEQGDYQLIADTCVETQTFCIQPSKLLNKTVKYNYVISKDTLKLSAVLPNGYRVEDYWIKIK